MEAEIKQAAERYTRMEAELTSARLQIQQFRSEVQQFASDVAQAVDAGRVEVASEIARANERAATLEGQYQTLKAEMDATIVSAAHETAALKIAAQGLQMDKQLLEAKVRRLEKASANEHAPAAPDSSEIARRSLCP